MLHKTGHRKPFFMKIKTLSTLMLVGLAVLAVGCRTFDYTEEDVKKERQQYEQAVSHDAPLGFLISLIPALGR
jgi:hypothetical protein